MDIDKLENQQLWKKRIEDYEKSQMSQTAWCRENNINLHNFKYWRSRLKNTQNNKIQSPKFIEMKPLIPEQSTMITLKFGRATLEISEKTDFKFLDQVLAVLKHHA